MEEKIWIKNQEGLKLSAIIHSKNSKCGIIIAHGFCKSKDSELIKKLAEALEKEFTVIRFDFSGNGESEGNFEDRTYTKYVEDLRSVINWLKPRVNEICVIGHSMGGSIAIIEYSKYRNFDKSILLAPGIESARKDIPKENFKENYVELKGICNKKLKIEYFKDRRKYDQLKLAEKIDIPTLIIVGENDEVISVNACKEFFNEVKSNQKEFIILKHGGHGFRKSIKEISSMILNFIEK